MNFKLYKAHIDIDQSILDHIIEYSNKKENLRKNAGNYFTKDINFLNNYKSLFETLTTIAKEYTNDNLLYRESWLNITRKNEFHHRHNHPNADFTSVLYLQTLEDDHIVFYGKHFDFDMEYPVKKGDFIIFESSVWHSVKKNTSKIDRITIGCDFNYSYNPVLLLMDEILDINNVE